MSAKQLLKHEQGFTLIELLVVIAIVGLLVTAGIVVFTSVQKRARDSRRKTDVNTLAKAYEQYYAENGNMYGSGEGNNSFSIHWAGHHFRLYPYLPEGFLPTDPLNSETYNYTIVSLPRNYPGSVNPTARFCVSAKLEVPNGNCTATLSNSTTMLWPSGVSCSFVPDGTGTHFCVSNKL